MALLEVFRSINFNSLPNLDGNVVNRTPTRFDVVQSGVYAAEITGVGFKFAADGEPLAGTVTGIDWAPASASANTLDFVLEGISWQLDGPFGDIGDTGYTVDGQTLIGNKAEVAYWLRSADTLLGSGFNDTMLGFGGNDVIEGNGGNDSLEGWSGNDLLQGGADNDTLNGGAGNDTLEGGLGDDLYLNPVGDVVVEAGGLDTVRYTSAAAGTYLLADGVENGTITAGGTLVIGLTGNGLNNVLTGGAGANVLSGGAGADTLAGGLGNDIYVADAADTINEANSTLGGTDTLRTFVDVFSLDTLGGIENLQYLGEGAFTGTGNALANRITGGAGNDTLNGGAGTDVLVGGAGDDEYVLTAVADVVSETLVGTAGGFDSVDLELAATGPYAYTLTANIEQGDAGGSNELAQVNITGNALDNFLIGHGGRNSLAGSTGNDSLDGDGGNDTLDGGAGEDIAFFFGGRSEYTATRDSATLVTVSDGTASVALTGIERVVFYLDEDLNGNPSYGPGQVYTLAQLLAQAPSAFNDTLQAIEGGDPVDGLAGNDILVGSNGSDLLQGGAGADTLDGAGGDTLAGGAGGDTYVWGLGRGYAGVTENDTVAGVLDTVLIEAGSGNLAGGEVRLLRDDDSGETPGADLLVRVYDAEGSSDLRIQGFFTAAGGVAPGKAIEQLRFADGGPVLSQTQILSQLLKAGAGEDQLFGYATGDVINGLEGNDTIAGNAGNDTLIGHLGSDSLDGGAGNDALQGNQGTDTLFGNDGADTLDGGIGFDYLYGDAGNDVLLGGSGEDYLQGGAGADTLTGGAGFDILSGGDDTVADRFVLNSLMGNDSISEFTSGTDKIAISKAVFTATTGLVGTNQIGPSWLYVQATGILTYDADGTGEGLAVPVALFDLGTPVAPTDFLIV